MSEKPTKTFKTYDQQIELLKSRGMKIRDESRAADLIKNINYYRLSGYWYPFRKLLPGEDVARRSDTFRSDADFDDVIRIYNFDQSLRTCVFACMAPIETALRASLGHQLGKTDPLIHLKEDLLEASSKEYELWREKYNRTLQDSRDDFVKHHKLYYSGKLPIWVATEMLDWGSLSYLYGFSPINDQNAIADEFGLTAVEMRSWLKSLNLLRNRAAHHGRMFNNVFSAPRKPRTAKQVGQVMEANVDSVDRCFVELTLVQYFLLKTGIGNLRLLPSVLRGYPNIECLPISVTGAPFDWQDFELWSY